MVNMTYHEFWKTVTYITGFIFGLSLLAAIYGELTSLVFGFTTTFFLFTIVVSFIYFLYASSKWKRARA